MTLAPPSLDAPEVWADKTVGILGGSFNPAHEGHRHISLHALERLGLDAVWWMVSPQNPLKTEKDMAPLEKRLAGAKETADHLQIIVSDIEQHLGTRYTVETLKALKKRFPTTRFVWLMGADNLLQFHLWKMWEEIFYTVPVCVLDRATGSVKAENAEAFERFRPHLIDEAQAATLKNRPCPAFAFLHIPLNPTSATEIRNTKKVR